MFRLIRRLARAITRQLRKVEMIVFNATMQRRGTIHSICDRGTLGRSDRRRATIHSIREVRLALALYCILSNML